MFERLPSRVSIARASAKRASTMKSTITMTSRPTKVHESSSIPKDATSKDVNSGRRALLMAMPGMLVLPSMQAEAPARAAEAAVEVCVCKIVSARACRVLVTIRALSSGVFTEIRAPSPDYQH